MKYPPTLPGLVFAIAILNPLSSLWAQGTAFAYQGRLSSGGAPATGSFDLKFTLYDYPSGGEHRRCFDNQSGRGGK